MTHQEFITKLEANQTELYSNEVNGINVFNGDYLTILIRKLESINYQDWTDQGLIESHLDIRFQLFVKIEMAAVHYFQSIVSTITGVEAIWASTKSLGYSNKFVMNTLTFREVSLRTSFLEKVFFEIDYFIQRMNSHIYFHTSGSTHKKQQYFGLLMDKLGLGNTTLNTSTLVEDLNKDIAVEYMTNLFAKVNGRNIKMSEIYNYLVSLRNTLHNNGYSQITLNKLNVGGIVFDIKKGKQINQSHSVVTTVVYMILYPLLRIVEETFKIYPKQYWEDPYTKELKDFVDEREKQRNANNT